MLFLGLDRDCISLRTNGGLTKSCERAAGATIWHTNQAVAHADLRNKADHGRWNEFSDKDVEEMIQSVRNFMEVHFA